MGTLVVRIIINAVAIAAITSGFLPGIRIVGENTYPILLGVGLIFGVVNGLIKPLIDLMTCALTLLTFGLFRLIVNGAMLMLTAYFSRLLEPTIGGRLEVDNLLWGIIGAIIASLVAIILERILGVDGDRDDDRRRRRRKGS
ncbi:MAG: phage holin family protein [Anaerolineae bacterium]|nr:phage holin family protein [Anaerolineae bacterium]